jgi:hypothetical protein
MRYADPADVPDPERGAGGTNRIRLTAISHGT